MSVQRRFQPLSSSSLASSARGGLRPVSVGLPALLLGLALLAVGCGSSNEDADTATDAETSNATADDTVTADDTADDADSTEDADTEETTDTAADTADADDDAGADGDGDAADDSTELFPDVLEATATAEGAGLWTFSATLSSPYDTAARYADAWRVTSLDGEVFGIRELTHDHASEQPFTRSHSGIAIPDGVETVIVEGRDQVSGWGGATVEVQLNP